MGLFNDSALSIDLDKPQHKPVRNDDSVTKIGILRDYHTEFIEIEFPYTSFFSAVSAPTL